MIILEGITLGSNPSQAVLGNHPLSSPTLMPQNRVRWLTDQILHVQHSNTQTAKLFFTGGFDRECIAMSPNHIGCKLSLWSLWTPYASKNCTRYSDGNFSRCASGYLLRLVTSRHCRLVSMPSWWIYRTESLETAQVGYEPRWKAIHWGSQPRATNGKVTFGYIFGIYLELDPTGHSHHLRIRNSCLGTWQPCFDTGSVPPQY